PSSARDKSSSIYWYNYCMRFLTSIIFLIISLILLVPIVSAQTFPKPGGYVNDFAKLYSDSYKQQLEKRLQTFEASTSAEVVIVTVNDLQDTTIDDYAVRLFEDWKIGKDKKDNGLLYLIAKEEREVRIEVGYGLESVVTDARAGRIIRDEVIPAFKDGDY